MNRRWRTLAVNGSTMYFDTKAEAIEYAAGVVARLNTQAQGTYRDRAWVGIEQWDESHSQDELNQGWALVASVGYTPPAPDMEGQVCRYCQMQTAQGHPKHSPCAFQNCGCNHGACRHASDGKQMSIEDIIARQEQRRARANELSELADADEISYESADSQRFDLWQAADEDLDVLISILQDPKVFVVTVSGCTAEQAQRVMSERLGPDEDYGFDYTVSYQ